MALTHKMCVGALMLGFLLPLAHSAFYYPNPQVHFLEHILVDHWGAYASNFSSAITPCSNYVTEVGEAAVKSGRTTAAQWMRVAFHDFVTANVSAGTGGIDASIGFETLRAENSGSAFNDSFTFWRPFVNDVVSMADLVAAGTVMSMALCGGHNVPYRPGRVDAVAEGLTTGVPAPESDLEETLLFFDRSGFNPSDAIGLTACGHTMGSVHHGGFPDVVPLSAVTENNTNGGANFDTTRAIFDSGVVHEYIDSTGNRGGSLVTTDNETTRSDLRLYESDGNATMQSLYELGDGFQATCVDLMGRMIHTVPKDVELQDAITPMSIKPVNTTFDFDANGNLFIQGRIRVLSPLTPSEAQSQIRASISSAQNRVTTALTLEAEPKTGSSVFGTTEYYTFSGVVDQNTTYSSLHVTDSENHNFQVQSQVFVVPSMTTINGSAFDITIASKDPSASLTVDLAIPTGQHGTLGPLISHRSVSMAKASKSNMPASSYQLWQASVNLGLGTTGAVTVGAVVDGHVEDVLYLNPGGAAW